jgi:asparagine synthase (glutamine-hydrolysing)
MADFLALVAVGGTNLAHARTLAVHETLARLQIVCDEPDLWLATSPDCRAYRIGTQSGWVIGRLHSQDATSGSPDVRTLLGAGELTPETLLRGFWGDFVAFLRPSAETNAEASVAAPMTIVRSPLGRLPCLYARQGSTLLVASDTQLLLRAGLPRPAVDVDQLTRRIAYRELPAARTCLAGIDQLRGGNALRLAERKAEQAAIWTPWQHAGRAHWLETRSDALDLVRRCVLQATRAATGQADRRLLLLSGGFDSSVLAVTLATLGGDYACLNLTYTGGAADERDHARAVAKRLGCELHEARWSVSDIDLVRSDCANRPDPVARSFMQGTNRVLNDRVEASGADCVIDGGGGDNVFCALRSVAPVADAWTMAPLGEAWGASRTLACLAQASIGAVLKRAALRALRRSPAYRWHGDTRFLGADVSATVSDIATHPWLVPPHGTSPGTAAQVALVAALQGWAEEPDLVTTAAHVSPLATQPVVEACLRIPSWWWLQDGQDRAVAREAFSSKLPASIITRCAKGSPDPFAAEIYIRNRVLIRPMLLDGGLQALGLLNRRALEAATTTDMPSDSTYLRLLQLVDAEAWLAAQA